METMTNMMKWTLSDNPSLPGRLAVVIGSNSGIGRHAALELAPEGSQVILASGTEAIGRDAVGRICKQLSAGEGADGGARPGEFREYGDGDRRLATRPPALSDRAFVGTSLPLLITVFNWWVLGLSASRCLQGEAHA